MTAKAAKAPIKKTKTTKAKTTATNVAKATTKATTSTSKNPRSPKSNLRIWNLRFGIVLLLLAVAVVVFGNDKTLPLTTQYLAKDALGTEAAAGQTVFATATRHLWDVHVSWIVAKFLVLFGVTYLVTATVWRKQYEAWLDRGVNKVRWIGFGFGTGAMAVGVAMLSGISDVAYLVLIFASLLILGGLAATVELLGIGRKLRKFVIITALVTATLPVLAIGSTLLGVVLYNGNLPVYMYFIYASMLLLAGAVALACILRLRKRGKWADTIYTERMFMIWGLVASVVLAAQIFAGALQ
jgi:hypothetical protein